MVKNLPAMFATRDGQSWIFLHAGVNTPVSVFLSEEGWFDLEALLCFLFCFLGFLLDVVHKDRFCCFLNMKYCP